MATSTDINRLDIKEFREAGYLQEANRRFFHPLGLALEVVVEDDGSERLGGVWDYRDDPEGMLYGEGYGADADKAARVDREWAKHAAHRMRELGFVVQPCPREEEPSRDDLVERDAPTITVDLQGCARCHGDGHPGLEFVKLAHPVPSDEPVPYTHWAPCPTNGEPIMMVIRRDEEPSDGN